jgi:hypothetical protein
MDGNNVVAEGTSGQFVLRLCAVDGDAFGEPMCRRGAERVDVAEHRHPKVDVLG